MSHWPFHSDFMEDIFVLQVRKRPGAGIAGLQKLRRIGILSKLISLYPVNCFLKSEHITLETVRFSVRVRMHTGVQRWVLVLVNQFLYFSRIAFSCINTCCLYILITVRREKQKIRTPVVLNICRHMTRECMFRHRLFQSGLLLHFTLKFDTFFCNLSFWMCWMCPCLNIAHVCQLSQWSPVPALEVPRGLCFTQAESSSSVNLHLWPVFAFFLWLCVHSPSHIIVWCRTLLLCQLCLSGGP